MGARCQQGVGRTMAKIFTSSVLTMGSLVAPAGLENSPGNGREKEALWLCLGDGGGQRFIPCSLHLLVWGGLRGEGDPQSC